MRIAVTGGAGFIGSHVVDAYIAAGHEVIVVDDLSTGKRRNVNPRARLVIADIRDASIRELIADERIEIVCHHAAQMDVRRSVADPVFDARVNILGLLNILEGARTAQCRTIIFASSGGTVYGEQQTVPTSETEPTAPLSPYGVSKLTGEHYLHYYQSAFGVVHVSLRYANVYGPRQDPHGEAGVVAIFVRRLLEGQPALINGDGQQTRDYVYVEDVARANLAAVSTRYTGPLNIGTGIETSVNELYAVLRRLTGSMQPQRHGPAKPGEQRRSALGCGRAAEVLGWRPRMGLEEGLAQTVEYFRQGTHGQQPHS